MKKTNLILAGSGYMGNEIIKQFSEYKHSYSITELSRSRKIRNSRIRSIQVDFDNIVQDMSYIDDCKIIYMAPPGGSTYKDTRIKNFLHKIKIYKINRVIYISTSGVYGNCNGERVSEKKKVNPLTDRAKRRVDAEEQVTKFCGKLDIELIILRVPGIYGKDRLPMKRINDAEPLIKMEESRTTNLIHVSDLARIAIESLDIDIHEKETINISDGTAIKTTKYYEEIYNALEKKLPLYITFNEAINSYGEKRLSFLKESRILDTTKMKKLFPNCIKYKLIKDGIKASL